MKFLIILILLLTVVSCVGSTDSKQKKQTEKMLKESQSRLGLPNIVNFTEKRFAKMIYELRDKEVRTYSYFMDMNGKLHLLCESIGYGLPYSVQYVNPEKQKWADSPPLPQAEPNGLFMPDSLDATFVLCINSKGKIKPVYSEPKLIVSPFKLSHVNDLRRLK